MGVSKGKHPGLTIYVFAFSCSPCVSEWQLFLVSSMKLPNFQLKRDVKIDFAGNKTLSFPV